ncbi:hypothetical protein, partial [Klebsiella aerogenes]|uniref:hypothetical protein n=1 Tax=Klebsiella aerogenes TaxID=548 RepID=UPI0019541D09
LEQSSIALAMGSGMREIFNFTEIILCILYFLSTYLKPQLIIQSTTKSVIIWWEKVLPGPARVCV